MHIAVQSSELQDPPPLLLLLLPPPEHMPPEQVSPAGQSATEQHCVAQTQLVPCLV
jgi:hypothetical protein